MKLDTDKTLSEIDQDLEAIIEKISQEDFSKSSQKEGVRRKVLTTIREKEANKMKKTYMLKKTTIAVASIALGMTLFGQTAIGQEISHKIMEVFSVGNGHINIIQEEAREIDRSVPENLKGKLFDAKGNEVTEFTDDIREIYTSEGEKIAYLTNNEDNEQVIVTEAQEEAEREAITLVVTDISERNNYTCFDVKVPEYLPEGYKFDRIELYKDEQGKVEESEYINIYYANEMTGEFIYMQQRLADEETGYTTGTDGTINQVSINGTEALIMDDKIIDWEANGVLYHLNGRGAFGKDELVKIAESIK